MKKRLKIPKYSSELFSIKYITIENNSLGIRGNCYDEDYNLGYEGAVSGFTSICDDAEALAELLNTSDLSNHIRFVIKNHIDLLEQYCKKHGLPCSLKTDEDEIQ